MTHPVGAARAAWLLTRLRLRRQLNQIQSITRYRMGSPGRKATSRTSPTMWIVSACVGLAMLGGFTNMASQCLTNIENVLGSVPVPSDSRMPGARPPAVSRSDAPAKRSLQPLLRPLPPAPGSALPLGVLQGATFEATMILIAALFLTLAGRELARPEWDLEWLVTLPLPLSTLLLSRLVERAFTNSAGIVTLGPFLSVLAWKCGYRWTAPVLGAAFTFALLFLVATVQTLIDTGFRLALSPPRLRNLQAALSVVGMFPLLLAMSMALPGDTFVFGWASALPQGVQWLPTGLAVRALAAVDIGSAALWSVLMAAEIAILLAVGLALLQRQMRNGVVAAGIREAGARRPQAARQAALPRATGTRTWLSTVQRRELRLLGRDRNFMVQTLLLPALIVGMQMFLNARTDIFAGAVENPSNLAAVAFGLAAYTLMFSAFQTLNAEGQALWILYCVPHSLESVLRQKAKLWAIAAAIYPLIIFAIAIALARDVSLQLVLCAAVALAGVPIFAVIATALGVFGCDPLALEVQRRVRATYLYLYMMLASLYAYAIYASGLWQRAALMILTALVALALWQKARDQLDYLLDPSASPPPRVSLSDGLIAALLFFVLQALVGLMQMGRGDVLTGRMVWISFCIAGVATYGIMRLIYWRARTADVPRMLGDGVARALLWGSIGGVAASAAGFAYIEIARTMDLLPAVRQAGRLADPALPLWLAALAIIAAPLFEEFIFRGLIFGGLRRSLGLPAATLASAAIFAIVHPPTSVIPVFIMGVGAALVYERTRMLAAPILLHAVYNASVLAFQWNVMQSSP